MAEEQKVDLQQILNNTRSMFSGGPLSSTPSGTTPPVSQEPTEKDNPPAVKPEDNQSTDPEKDKGSPPNETADKEVADPKTVSTEKKTEPRVIQTPLFDLKIEGSSTEPSSTDMIALFNQKTGLNIEKPEDVFEKADEIAGALNASSAITGEIREALEYKALFENFLPDDLRAPIVAFLEKKDYKSLMRDLSDDSVSFSKRFVEYADVFPVVRRYNPDVTREEFDDMDDIAKKSIVKMAEKAYNVEYEGYVSSANKIKRDRAEAAERLDNSIKVSMENVKKEFPKLSKKELDQILDKHNRGIRDDLFNTDGTYKPDAGVKIVMASYGKKTVDALIKDMTASHREELEREVQLRVSEEKELLNRGRNDTIDTGKTDVKTPTPDQEIGKVNLDMFQRMNSSSGLANRNKRS